MNQKKLLYSFLVLGMVSGPLSSTVVSFASETKTPIATEATSLPKESCVETATSSEQTAQGSKQTSDLKEQSSNRTTQSFNQTGQVTAGEWTVDKTTPGVIKILGYTGTQANVVIPTADDLNSSGDTVTISKVVLQAIAATSTTTSLAFSQNGQAIELDGTDLSGVFAKCNNLMSVRLKGLDTSKVTSLAQAFYKCSNLETVDLTGIDTGKVTQFNDLFANCESIQSLDLSSLNTTSATDMRGMFQDCTHLAQLNLAHVDTSNVTDMFTMFSGCVSLQALDLSSFDTKNVADMNGLFANCQHLMTLNIQSFNTASVEDMTNMFLNCQELTTLDVSGFDTQHVTSMKNLFSGCRAVKQLEVQKFDTSNVTDMSGMFNECRSVTSLDVAGFQTQQVTNMNGVFNHCENVQSLPVDKWNTEKATTMISMFSGCSKVSVFNVSNFDTSHVTVMKNLFSGCYAAEQLDIQHFDTSKVTDMSGMFNDCKKIVQLDLKNFQTSTVLSMQNMFSNCHVLATVNVTSFDTHNVTNMQNMFAGCPKLVHLDLENFDTTKASMQGMFLNTQKTPLLVYVKTDIKLRAYNYTGDNRMAPVVVSSGTKGTFGSKGTSQYLFPLCITNQPLSQFDPTETNSAVKKQLDTFKTQLQKLDKNYVATNWQYTEGVGGSDLDNKINAYYTASWAPIITLGATSVTKQVGNTYGETELRKNIKTLLNQDGQSSLSTDRSTVTLTAINTINKANVSLNQLTKTAGTYEITYAYGGASTKLTLQVTAVPVTQYTVTFKPSTGGTLTGTTSMKVVKGGKVSTVPTVKTATGYTFSGWYNASNKKVEPKTVVINGNTTFTAKFTKNAVSVKKIAMYRLYNPNSGEHFYTANSTERDKVKKAGWRYEGIGWYAPEKGTPVYRVYNPNAGDHHYTTNLSEKNKLVKVGWKYEGISWYSGGSVKVYRQYNKNAKSGAHNYTTNKAENDHLVKVGWKAEGIGWYAQ